jgi:molecular chaperone DnaK
LGTAVSGAVICLPAFFNDVQKAEIRRAAKSAGLEALRIYNAATAAAAAHSIRMGKPGSVAVVDLGSSSLSISILEIGEGIIEVKSTNGSSLVGGDLFDEKIMECISGEFRCTTHIDLSTDPAALLRLREAAEKTRCSLTDCLETEFAIPFVAVDAAGPRHVNKTMRRGDMEILLAGPMSRIEEPCRAALRDAGIKPGDLSELVLVGGSARMPAIQQKLREIFGLEPRRFMGSDDTAAAGAAVLGATLSGDLKDTILLDVTPFFIGIERSGGRIEKVVLKNATLPTRQSLVLCTTEDNQASIPVHVVQGDAEMASENQTLFTFEVAVPPAPRGNAGVKITFDIDPNGLLRVQAADKSTGREIPLKMHSPETAAAMPGGGRCTSCDALLDEGDRFCGECGKPYPGLDGH